MSQDPREPAELSELFEQSASALDPLARGRLRALAREIPRRRGGFSLPSRWAWALGLCVLSGAGALTLVALRTAPSAKPLALRSAPPSAMEAQSPPGVVTESDDVDEFDELASGADFEDATGPDVLDDLALDPGDLSDSEVDAWISAANTTLGG